jgi:chain length determinant protein EpsF
MLSRIDVIKIDFLESDQMTFQQFIIILIARKWTILSTFAFVVITVTALSLVWPKSYTAETTVVVDVKNPDPVMGLLSGALLMPGYMATQVDIIGSDRVARRVVKMLGFEKVPELVAQWKDDTEGAGTIEGYYAQVLSKKLLVTPSRESNVITIDFTGSDPRSAAAVANAFAQAYIDTNVDLSVEPAKQYTEWFAKRAQEVRERLEKAQAALSAAQKEKGIVSVDDRLDAETARLNDLSSQLTILEEQKSEAQSRQREARSNIETNPDVMNNPVIQNLRATITTAEGKLQESSNTLGPNHPQVKEQKAELESLKVMLKNEMANVASSLGTNTLVSVQKEAEVRGALAAQKSRVLDLKKQHDAVSVLMGDVATTQRDYDAVNQRLSQSDLQSQSQQTNISVLTPAEEPLKPSKPKVVINILVSIFLGIILGVGRALLKEQTDRRIYAEEDLAEIGIPVLGVLVEDRSSSSSRWKFWLRLKAVS